MERLSVDVDSVGRGRFVLRLTGELELAGADGFWGVLEPLLVPGGRVVLDCAELGFLDSSGLRTLILGARRAAAVGSSVRLAAPCHTVRRTLELAGAQDFVASYGSVEQALADGPEAGTDGGSDSSADGGSAEAVPQDGPAEAAGVEG
jgi:anti-sigma B factor antagonist